MNKYAGRGIIKRSIDIMRNKILKHYDIRNQYTTIGNRHRIRSIA